MITTTLLVSSVVLQLVTIGLVLYRRRHLATERHELGMQYARLAHTYGAAKGGTPQQQRVHALAAFRLADETADGKRDFTEQQAAVYLEAVEAEGKA